MTVLDEPIIYFGSLIVEQLFTVLDYESKQVGLAVKGPPSSGSFSSHCD